MTLPDDFKTDEGFDPCEDYIGPFYYRRNKEGGLEYAFPAEAKHCNTHGIVHGGVLMTFADYCLCMEATDHYNNESCITVNFNCDFVSAAEIGNLIQCAATVTRKTGSMAFIRGEVFTESEGAKEVVMTFSSVVKRLRDQG